jgi:transposase
MNTPSSAALAAHYSLALGLTEPWKVTAVTLDTKAQTLDIDVTYDDKAAPCPLCGASSSFHDLREPRSWRHLDMMQFETTIRAQVPRTSCTVHGVKSIGVPWAEPHSRFTLLFEAFAIEVLENAASVSGGRRILALSWDQLHLIQKHAVERGLKRREDEVVRHAGIDEKSFLKGHHYASLATDLDRGRVLEVIEHRTLEAAMELLQRAIPEAQRPFVEAGAMDMWQPFMDAWTDIMQKPIVHDKFHVSGYLGDAVDRVRRKEHRTLCTEGDVSLTSTKYLWLKDPKGWSTDEKKLFRSLMKDEFAVGRAWTLKELFRHFWDLVSVPAALRFFKRWYFRATHSRLKPMIEIAKTLMRHLQGLLAHCTHPITNAVTEGLNSKIQAVKADARGFRNFANYRIAILFHCGKLDMVPRPLHSNA